MGIPPGFLNRDPIQGSTPTDIGQGLGSLTNATSMQVNNVYAFVILRALFFLLLLGEGTTILSQ
jgi:hypothetical protein